MECPLPLTEYIVDILITCLKDAMVESPLRNEMIYTVLEQNPDVHVHNIFKPNRNDSQEVEQEKMVEHLQNAIVKGGDSRFIATTLMNPPSGNADETHFVGCVIDTHQKKIYYYNTGAGTYPGSEHILKKIKSSKVLSPYKIVQEDDTKSSCQIDVIDTFCQTWSAYYIVKRIQNSHFGAELRKHALKALKHEKLEKIFDVFQMFTRTIPDKTINYIAKVYKETQKLDKKIKNIELPNLTVDEIRTILSHYFADKTNLEEFTKMIALPPEPSEEDEKDDPSCIRSILPGSEQPFYKMIGRTNTNTKIKTKTKITKKGGTRKTKLTTNL